MTDLILYLYLIDIFGNLDRILRLALVILFVLSVAAGFTTLVCTVHDGFDTVKPFLRKAYKPFIIVFCALGLLKTVIPSKQTMYVALGLHTASQVMQQPQMVEVGNQAMRILRAKLGEYEENLTQENKGEGEE